MEAPTTETQHTYCEADEILCSGEGPYAGQTEADQLRLDVDAAIEDGFKIRPDSPELEASPKTLADPDRVIGYIKCGTPCMPVEDAEKKAARIAHSKVVDAYYTDRRNRIMDAAKDIADVAIAFHLTPGELLDAVNHAQDSMCFTAMPAELRPPEGCW